MSSTQQDDARYGRMCLHSQRHQGCCWQAAATSGTLIHCLRAPHGDCECQSRASRLVVFGGCGTMAGLPRAPLTHCHAKEVDAKPQAASMADDESKIAPAASNRGYLSIRLSAEQCVPFAAATQAWRDALPPSLQAKIDPKPQKLHFTVLTDTSGDVEACLTGMQKWCHQDVEPLATPCGADMGTTNNVFFLRFESPWLETLTKRLFNDKTVNPRGAASAHGFYPPHLTLAWFSSSLNEAERCVVEQTWAQLAPTLPRIQLQRAELMFKTFAPTHKADRRE